ncbi:MAG: C40 family peptidase, partial [Armatimonadota bacterium]
MSNTKNWTIAALAVLILLSAAFSAFAAKNKTSPTSQDGTAPPVATNSADTGEGPDEINVVLQPNQPSDTTQTPSADHSPCDSGLEQNITSQPLDERLEIKSTALQFLGTPYRWGGTTPTAFDCSGFTRYLYAKLGVALPRTARQQYKAGKPVKAGNWKPGDLVFFDIKKGYVSHVGLYLTSCAFIHASNPMCGVKIDSL